MKKFTIKYIAKIRNCLDCPFFEDKCNPEKAYCDIDGQETVYEKQKDHPMLRLWVQPFEIRDCPLKEKK